MGIDGRLFLGFDGGRSGSRALLVDGGGHIVHRSTGPAFDHVRVPSGSAKIRRAFRECLNVPGIQDRPVDTAFLGLTGLWSSDSPEAAPIREILSESFSAASIILDNDAVSCWAGAFAGQPGVVVAAGSGVVAYGMNRSGAQKKLGGWGNVMGDLGGAFDIGRRALQEATAAEDRGDSSNVLKDAIVAHFGLPSLRALQSVLYERNDHVALVAQCSKIVSVGAQSADPACMRILREAGRELGRLASQTAAALGWDYHDSVPFAVAGGVSSAGAALLDPFCEVVKSLYPRAFVARPVFQPVVGAALMAMSAAGLGARLPQAVAVLQKEWVDNDEMP